MLKQSMEQEQENHLLLRLIKNLSEVRVILNDQFVAYIC
jgi:hypothetical protein